MKKTDMTITALAVGITTIALLMMAFLGTNATTAYAIPIPTCHLCSIHGDGEGTITIPDDVAQFPGPPCQECAADITFDATQNGKNTAFGKMSLAYFPGVPCPACVISGDIVSGKISEKQFVLKGLVEAPIFPCQLCGPVHFTLSGQVGKGIINFQTDNGTEGTFSGTVTVTVTE